MEDYKQGLVNAIAIQRIAFDKVVAQQKIRRLRLNMHDESSLQHLITRNIAMMMPSVLERLPSLR